MKIGVISDSHDRINELKKAITLFQVRGVQVLIHCGDFCAPFMMEELSKFKGEIHCVFGNIDDRYLTPKKAREFGINFHGDLAELNIGGKNIAVNHYPKIARALASTGDYDAVFYGHSHISKIESYGKTILLNPGELMKRKTGPSIAIYDTETADAEIIKLIE